MSETMTKTQAINRIESLYDGLSQDEQNMIIRLYGTHVEGFDIKNGDPRDLIRRLDVKKLRVLVYQVENSITKKLKEL